MRSEKVLEEDVGLKYCSDHFWKLRSSTIISSEVPGMGKIITCLQLLDWLLTKVVWLGGWWLEFMSYGEGWVWPCPFRDSPNCFLLFFWKKVQTYSRESFTCSLPCSKLQTFHNKFCCQKLKDSTEHIFCLFDESVFDPPPLPNLNFKVCQIDDMHHQDLI